MKETHLEDIKQFGKDIDKKLEAQKMEYETKLERNLAFIDQLVIDKKNMAEELEAVLKDKVD